MTQHVTDPHVTAVEEWIIGPENIPFFTKRVDFRERESLPGADPSTQWSPKNEEPKAYILFVHGGRPVVRLDYL